MVSRSCKNADIRNCWKYKTSKFFTVMNNVTKMVTLHIVPPNHGNNTPPKDVSLSLSPRSRGPPWGGAGRQTSAVAGQGPPSPAGGLAGDKPGRENWTAPAAASVGLLVWKLP